MRKTFAALALAVYITTLGATAAQATYTHPTAPRASSVSQSTVIASRIVTFSGSGFKPLERVDVIVSSRGVFPIITGAGPTGSGGRGASVIHVAPGTMVPASLQAVMTAADADGEFSLDITLSDAGVYTPTALGAESGATHSNKVTVIAADITKAALPVAGEDALSDTGADALGANGGVPVGALIGGGILLAGAGTVAVALRRGREAAAQ